MPLNMSMLRHRCCCPLAVHLLLSKIPPQHPYFFFLLPIPSVLVHNDLMNNTTWFWVRDSSVFQGLVSIFSSLEHDNATQPVGGILLVPGLFRCFLASVYSSPSQASCSALCLPSSLQLIKELGGLLLFPLPCITINYNDISDPRHSSTVIHGAVCLSKRLILHTHTHFCTYAWMHSHVHTQT